LVPAAAERALRQIGFHHPSQEITITPDALDDLTEISGVLKLRTSSRQVRRVDLRLVTHLLLRVTPGVLGILENWNSGVLPPPADAGIAFWPKEAKQKRLEVSKRLQRPSGIVLK